MGEVYLPETAELRALREQLRRDAAELAIIEAALARIPQSVRDRVAIAAQRKEKYGIKEFVAYIRSWMTARNLFHGVHLAYWLYGLYLSKYTEAHAEEPSGPSWGGGGGAGWNFTPLMAPADGSGSVVDAVFAKAERQQERRAA
jgi:hypothetical protein